MQLPYIEQCFEKIAANPGLTNISFEKFKKYFIKASNIRFVIWDNLSGLNGFKRGQTHINHLHISLDPGELENYNFVCSLITVMRGFSKVTSMGCDY